MQLGDAFSSQKSSCLLTPMHKVVNNSAPFCRKLNITCGLPRENYILQEPNPLFFKIIPFENKLQKVVGYTCTNNVTHIFLLLLLFFHFNFEAFPPYVCSERLAFTHIQS